MLYHFQCEEAFYALNGLQKAVCIGNDLILPIAFRVFLVLETKLFTRSRSGVRVPCRPLFISFALALHAGLINQAVFLW